MTYDDYVSVCRALGDETRLKIFDMLKGGKLCACKILEKFNCTQPTLSYHMNILVGCGLIDCEKCGKWCHYSINEKVMKEFSDFLTEKRCENNGGCICD
jgi:ArsR family transcriptional regulator